MLMQPERAGKRTRLVRDAFHQAAVADEHTGVMSDDVETVAVEVGGKDFFSERHADRVGKPLSERAGSRLDARRATVFGVAGCFRVQLAETLDLCKRQVVTGQ